MAKLLYSATASLDGFIAGAGGDMQWLTEHLGPNRQVDALIPRIGALLVGRNTHGGDDPNRGSEKEGAFGGAWSGPEFVLSHEPGEDRPPHLFYLDDLERAIAAAKEAAGERYVNVLGADVARQCLELGVLDEVLVLVAPVMLGDGVRLFEHPGGAEVALERTGVEVEAGVTNLWFRVIR
jgi:dihydrofolate reductase